MNINEFSTNLSIILKTMAKSDLLKNIHSANFALSELAQLQLGLINQAVEATFMLRETQIKEQEASLTIKKTLSELEILTARERLNNLKAYADGISSIIQAESIKRSVVDNASINKANAYIGYFNVAMNAIANNSASLNEGSTLANVSQVVLEIINQIDNSTLPEGYAHLLKDFVDLSQKESMGIGARQVSIWSAKNSIAINESILICGLSIYSNAECEFSINNKSVQEYIESLELPSIEHMLKDSKTLLFYATQEGVYHICFKVKDKDQEYISESLDIFVQKPMIGESK